MTPRRRLALAGLLLLCAAAAALFFVRSRTVRTRAQMLGRLPVRDAVVVYADVDVLRRAGVWKRFSSLAPEEAEYRQFVEASGFDYTRDLDAVAGAFHPGGTYFILRGRFDWDRLERYAAANQGACLDGFCRMTGSRPERKISFFALDREALALAVSTDESAASRLRDDPRGALPFTPPAEPVWLATEGAVLRRADTFPEPARAFARALRNSERIAIAAGAVGDSIAIKLEVSCANESEAVQLAAQLANTAAALRDAAAGAEAPELLRVLAGGRFDTRGRQVAGLWTIRP